MTNLPFRKYQYRLTATFAENYIGNNHSTGNGALHLTTDRLRNLGLALSGVAIPCSFPSPAKAPKSFYK